jgi:parvulin-like peptidyl-prolyl isomerase
MVGTMIGATIFLMFLLFAAQFLVRLYATSVVTAATYQAAQAVATAGDGPSAIPAAEDQARQRMGSFGGPHAQFIWREVDGQQVVLEVIDESPSFTPLPASYRRIERTVTVRTERFR